MAHWMESASQLAPAMKRDVSLGSVGSRRSQAPSVKTSLSRSHSRLPTLAQAPAEMSAFTGKVSAGFPEDPLASTRMLDVPQYLLQGPEAGMLSLHLQTGIDHLAYSPEMASMGQHMNPAHMQLFDNSPSMSSPDPSWDSLSTSDTAVSSPPPSHDFYQQQMETGHNSSTMLQSHSQR